MDQDDAKSYLRELLPVGRNSFFRQLDHMIATLCNEDFSKLYNFTRDLLLCAGDNNSSVSEILIKDPPIDVVKKYSDLKAAIFTRYRTLSELLGAHLLLEAQKLQLNCMLETSGRDVAMFHYVNQMFPSEKYNKLALHFTINDLKYAQYSVDRRMIHEIQSGIRALESGSVQSIIQANEGGPYGSEVLPGVQEDSDRVWKEIVMNRNDDERVGKDWYKATINIYGHDSEPWTAQAVRNDGTLGTMFTFERK